MIEIWLTSCSDEGIVEFSTEKWIWQFSQEFFQHRSDIMRTKLVQLRSLDSNFEQFTELKIEVLNHI